MAPLRPSIAIAAVALSLLAVTTPAASRKKTRDLTEWIMTAELAAPEGI